MSEIYQPEVTEQTSKSPEKERPVQDRWYEAWIEGNLRLPQHFLGIASNIAEVFLADTQFSFHDLFASELTEEQIKSSIKTMSTTHGSHEIKEPENLRVRSGQKEGVQSVWRSGKLHALDAIRDIYNAMRPEQPIADGPAQSVAQALDSRVDSQLRHQIWEIFEIIVSSLRSPAVLEQSARLRDSLSPSGKLASTYAGEIKVEIRSSVLTAIHNKFPDLALPEKFLKF